MKKLAMKTSNKTKVVEFDSSNFTNPIISKWKIYEKELNLRLVDFEIPS